MPSAKLLLSCEHAVNAIPTRYAAAFESRSAQRALDSHRGYDIGAAALAQRLADVLRCEFVAGSVSRLLVDLNRSHRHGSLFSEFSRKLAASDRQTIIETYYRPYVGHVRSAATALQRAGAATLHLSIHSFTPKLRGQRRMADIGLLYDPTRVPERAFCRALQQCLGTAKLAPEMHSVVTGEAGRLTVRRNYPYRGTADGLTTQLRREFSQARYLGIEIEINQQLFAQRNDAGDVASVLAQWLAAAVQHVLHERAVAPLR